jgi:hypothetical protein
LASKLKKAFEECRTAEDLKHLSQQYLQRIEPGVTHEIRCVAPPIVKTECSEGVETIFADPAVIKCQLGWAECAFQAIGPALMSHDEAMKRPKKP